MSQLPATPAHVLDITADTCPMTFVRTRLALDRMQSGEVLQGRLRGEEPWRNVVANAQALGHTLLSDRPEQEDASDGVRRIAVRKR